MSRRRRPSDWQIFWAWVRSDQVLTVRFLVLVTFVLVSVSLLVSFALIPIIWSI